MKEATRAEVRVLTAGGTIDKRYDAATGILRVGRPAILEAFRKASVERATEPLPALTKDSRDITEGERLLFANVVAAAQSDAVLVTHGTDTIAETAELIDSLDCGKTVVLTGAMVPSSFPDSDADFNLGFAYAAAQLLPPGVYVAMHGKVVHHSKYRKDRAAGRFVEVRDHPDAGS